jgi:hypothetical protein
LSIETYYTVLGVSETASPNEIKVAYRELIRQVHPDSVPNATPYWKRTAEEKTKEINEAYGVLSDQRKRREYDKLLAEARPGSPPPQPSTTNSPPPQSATQAQAAGPYCAKCGTSLYGSGYCPSCQKISAPSKGGTSAFNRSRSIHIPRPTDIRNAALLCCLAIVAAAVFFALLRLVWVALVCSLTIAALLGWRKLFKVYPQFRRVCIVALVGTVSFVIADVVYPAEENKPSQIAATPEPTKRQSVPVDELEPQEPRKLPSNSPPVATEVQTQPLQSSLTPPAIPVNGVFSSDPMDGYGPSKTFMDSSCSWNNVDPQSKKQWAQTGVLAGHTFLISPRDETCYIWNQDVGFFVAKGALRGTPVVREDRVVGYRKPTKENTTSSTPAPEVLSTPPVAVPVVSVASVKPASPSFHSDPLELSASEKQSIESVCSTAKHLEGPAAYNRCLAQQLEELAAGPKQPDLSGLTYAEKQSIESVCSTPKHLQGPAAYNQCLVQQLQQLAAGPRQPDLSGLTYAEKQSIESVCSTPKHLQGPAAYNQCLVQQLQQLAAGPRQPDLSGLTYAEKQSIESVCSTPKHLQGPAAYNLCLVRQLQSLRSYK